MIRRFLAPLVALALVACSFLSSPKGQATALFTARDGVCIYEHRAEPVVQILKDCNVANDAIDEVATLVEAHRAGDAKLAAARCGVAVGENDAGK